MGDQVELPRVYMSWITDPIYTQGDAECDMVARILGGGKSSRLYKSLVYEKRIAQDAAAQQYSLSLGSIFSIEATAKPGVEPSVLEKAIDEELEAFRLRGPTTAEVERARNAFESAIIRGLENLGGFGGVADRLNQYNHFLGDPGRLAWDLERYHKATPSSLQALAQKRLVRNSRVVIYGVPGEKSVNDVPRSDPAEPPAEMLPPASGQEWRRTVPKPGLPSALKLPVPRRFRLENGLTVYLLEQHSLPIVSANLVVLCGSDRNPLDLPGLASFTAEMLDEGTKKRSTLQIACDADQLGASLSTGSTMDMSVVAFRSLKRNVDAVFELAADVLLNPEFPESEVERLRNERLTQLLQQKDNPNTLAAKFFAGELYGPAHPYGYIELGTEAANKAITRWDLVRFREGGYSPAISALIVTGDVTEDELRNIAARHLGSWTGTGAPAPPPDTGPGTDCRIVIVDKPASQQTALRIGHVGVERSHPDYVPLNVMNAALGGLFSSRINLNLREKHGYTYGASSSFVYRRSAGPFLVGTSVRTDATADAVREILSEIEQMRCTEIAPAELATAKDSIARSLPGLFETSPQAVSSLGQLFVHNLADDYYRGLPERIDSVTAADVRRVAEEHLHPGRMIVVAVGDHSKIRSALEELRIGPVRCVDLEGNLLGNEE